MQTLIDKAFEELSNAARARAASELITLEKEIDDARRNMRESWSKVCEAEGISPGDIKTMQTLEVSDENIKLGETYQLFARLFVAKLARYKKLCKIHGIKPDPSVVKEKEVSQNNERRESNNRESNLVSPGSRQRQTRRGDRKRLSRRGKKEYRRN